MQMPPADEADDGAYKPIIGAGPARTFDEGIAFETAEWFLTILNGHASAAIDWEEQQPRPDEDKISQLRAEQSRLAGERRAMMRGGPAAVQRVLDIYGPRVRQLHPER
jgi:hypothetical protein